MGRPKKLKQPKVTNRVPLERYYRDEHISGVTIELIREFHTSDEVERFCNWHTGQTGAVGVNGEMVIYSHDYENFVGMLAGKPERLWD